MAKKLRITQIRSAIGRQFDQKGTLKALGIHKLNATVLKEDTPQIRGMIRKISHLLVVEEIKEKQAAVKGKKSKTAGSEKKKKSQDSKEKTEKMVKENSDEAS